MDEHTEQSATPQECKRLDGSTTTYWISRMRWGDDRGCLLVYRGSMQVIPPDTEGDELETMAEAFIALVDEELMDVQELPKKEKKGNGNQS